MDLIQDIKQRLATRKSDWLAISKAAGISHSWVVKFMDDQIPNPGYLTLVKLKAHVGRKRKTGNDKKIKP